MKFIFCRECEANVDGVCHRWAPRPTVRLEDEDGEILEGEQWLETKGLTYLTLWPWVGDAEGCLEGTPQTTEEKEE